VNCATQRPLPIATSGPAQLVAIADPRAGIADAEATVVTEPAFDDDDAEDFEDVTIPDQICFAPLEVTFDPMPVRACERDLRATRRRARVRRVIAYFHGGEETVAARPRARRRAPRRSQLAGLSLLATALALVLTGTLV
jgi:hypothetical protein